VSIDTKIGNRKVNRLSFWLSVSEPGDQRAGKSLVPATSLQAMDPIMPGNKHLGVTEK